MVLLATPGLDQISTETAVQIFSVRYGRKTKGFERYFPGRGGQKKKTAAYGQLALALAGSGSRGCRWQWLESVAWVVGCCFGDWR